MNSRKLFNFLISLFFVSFLLQNAQAQKSSLLSLHGDHKGKVSDKWQSTLETYDEILQPYRNSRLSILEIGIQNGGSLEVWGKFFPKAERIFGIDIDPKCAQLKYDNPKIRVFVADATKQDSLKKIGLKPLSFDIIIDDGSHKSGDVIRTFCLYYPLLKEGGLYIIEDLHTSYWKPYGGGIEERLSSLSFFKSLVDVINHEFWSKSGSKTTFLNPFFRKYGCDMSVDTLSTVHFVQFFNSLCIIQKRDPGRNLLGNRVISGKNDLVAPKEKLAAFSLDALKA